MQPLSAGLWQEPEVPLEENKHAAPGAAVSPILPPQDGYLFQDKAKFPASFAADVDAEKAAFWADFQVPWGVAASSGTISELAWWTKPRWYLIATDDRMIPPEAQRAMAQRAGATVVEVKASHAVYVSQPSAVAALIEQAARTAKAATA
jgi:pimeloyl-ACP methyl ester carboxylesterase